MVAIRTQEGPSRSRRQARRGLPSIPWILWRYVLIEVLQVFAISILALSLVSVVVFGFQMVHLRGFSLRHIYPLLFDLLAYPLFYSVPISLLFGCTLGYGRLVGDREVLAMRANGLSYRTLYLPTVLVACLVGVFAYQVNGYWIPEVHFQKRNVRRYVLEELSNLGQGHSRRLPLPPNGSVFCKYHDGNYLQGIVIRTSDLYPGARQRVTGDDERWDFPAWLTAKEGTVEIAEGNQELVVRLRGCNLHFESARLEKKADEVRHKDPFFQTLATQEIPLRIPLDDKDRSTKDYVNPDLRAEIGRFRDDVESAAERAAKILSEIGGERIGREEATGSVWSIFKAKKLVPAVVDTAHRYGWQGEAPADIGGAVAALIEGLGKREHPEHDNLQDALLTGYYSRKQVHKLETEWGRRIAFALSTFSFALVGLPLPLLLNRRSRLVPFFVGNLTVVAIFYPFLMLGIHLGEEGYLPLLSTNLQNLMLLGIAFLLYRALKKQ